MIFGTVFTGQIKTQNKQYIETKMLCIFIPIYVMTTMLVTEVLPSGRQGIEIKTHPLSIVAAAVRSIITVIFLFSLAAFIANYDEMTWLLIPTIVSLVLFVYLWFYFGRTTPYERFVREQFGKTFGIYTMPEWLMEDVCRNYYERAVVAYEKNYNTRDWKDQLKSTLPGESDFKLRYCITHLESILNNDTEIKTLLRQKYEESIQQPQVNAMA
ncbi:MAG TPA: hypothetical protein VIU12_22090 [Chryseolinea sp.]